MKGRLRIGLAALVAALAIVFVPQAMAGFLAGDVIVAPEGNGSGFVDGDSNLPASNVISCFYNGTSPSGVCLYNVASGTELITLTATPSVGSAFGGWQNTCPGSSTASPTGGTCTTLQGSGDAFDLIEPLFVTNRTLTVTKTGSGSGTVQSASGAINCGTTCAVTAPAGTDFVLTATPSPGSVFTGWTGCTSVNAQDQCLVTLNQNTTVTANFNSLSVLTVSVAGTGNVTSSPAGINCGNGGTTCTANVANGVSVTLNATPGAGQVFAGWQGGGCSGTGACVVTVSASTTVTATFQPAEVQAAVTGNKTRCTGPKNFRRQLTVTIDSDQTITVVIRLRNSQGVQVQRRGPVVRGANLFQLVMNIPNSRPNGKYTAQVTMTNQFGTQKVQTRNVKLKSC